MVITSVITDRIGRHEILLPINHNHDNSPRRSLPPPKKKKPLEQISQWRQSESKNSSILEIPQFLSGETVKVCWEVVVAMVIVIDSVIDGL